MAPSRFGKGPKSLALRVDPPVALDLHNDEIARLHHATLVVVFRKRQGVGYLRTPISAEDCMFDMGKSWPRLAARAVLADADALTRTNESRLGPSGVPQ